MWYEIDFKKLVTLYLPMRLRKRRMTDWVKVLIIPLMDLHYSFTQKREQDWFILQHNGQVCYLRAALNAEFDPGDKRIKIIDGNAHVQPYLYTRAEEKPKFLGTIYLYNRIDYSDGGVDFIVQVPEDLTYDNYEMKATIDKYRLATKTYKIEKV